MPRRLRVASAHLIRNSDIKVMPADKGSRIVIMDTDEYIAAGNLMLSDTNVYKKLTCRVNPLNYRVKAFNNNLERIFPENSKFLKRFRIAGASEQLLPYLYLLPKIYKPSPPLKFRLIVSQYGTYNAPLSNFVASILKPLVGTFLTLLANSLPSTETILIYFLSLF